MGDIANKDESDKCLQIAQAALTAGNYDKAARFADKAMKLYPSDQVRLVLRQIRSKQGGSSASSSAATENGHGPSLGSARQRPATRSTGPVEDKSTPEQRTLVRTITKTKDYYEILAISRDATDDDIKRAYRKLALKLHPDKNVAKGAEEAFKAVSKAFSCLSDPQKRAAYDRHGDEDPVLARQQNSGSAQYYSDQFDPEEIFNMFFNGGFPNTRGRVFRTHFGGMPRQQQRPAGAQAQQASNPILQLMHLLPVLLLLLFTFFSSPSDPVFSLDPTGDYRDAQTTRQFKVPYYVKNNAEFEKQHPHNSRERHRVEQEVEFLYKDRLEKRCYAERLNQQKLYRWGQKDRAKAMELNNCDEIAQRFGYRYSQTVF
ncbi:hypothetical protein WJX72_011593 [[Myrmecia] bisecta]|uniref:J domain-containing protein n=1 Tax=[Myrmecia] bisecta TaxID=41462 RepID=A0AAW1R9A1_9CHLO